MSEIAEFALHSLPKVDPLSVRTKRDAADLVSNRDYAMESKIIETIHHVFPEHAVISEEIGVVGKDNSQHQWLVDPIDGSCNDSHGIPWSCVSVAYVNAGQITAGLVVHPYTGEVFQAIHGQGATLNGQAIRVSNVQSLSGSVVMTELLNQRPWDGMFRFIDYLANHDAIVRIMGSTALAITQVAAGRGIAAILADAGQLDVAAGVLIATEAGAVVLQDGKPLDSLPHGRLTIACPGVVTAMEEARVMLSQ
jgi:fructose-1,6-bisphosphatase/inositol monophosphatase family enzyme